MAIWDADISGYRWHLLFFGAFNNIIIDHISKGNANSHEYLKPHLGNNTFLMIMVQAQMLFDFYMLRKTAKQVYIFISNF